jgi:hypothetical protein
MKAENMGFWWRELENNADIIFNQKPNGSSTNMYALTSNIKHCTAQFFFLPSMPQRPGFSKKSEEKLRFEDFSHDRGGMMRGIFFFKMSVESLPKRNY